MLEAKPQSSLTAAITIALVILVLTSCKVIPKDYPIDKPFVFQTNIKLEGNFTKEEKDALTSCYPEVAIRACFTVPYAFIRR